jgi:hypothetical protein
VGQKMANRRKKQGTCKKKKLRQETILQRICRTISPKDKLFSHSRKFLGASVVLENIIRYF